MRSSFFTDWLLSMDIPTKFQVSHYTTEQVQQLYGLTSANICHIVRVHHISKVKVGVKNLLLKVDVERAMAERAAKGL